MDFMPGAISVIEIFEFKQLIEDPARTTPYSLTLIYLYVTNAPTKINSEIIDLSISDHVLVKKRRTRYIVIS